MDEAEWLASGNPRRLYGHARKVATPRLNSGRRLLRLYACACCRQVWHLLGAEGRAAVEVAERYADGRASKADLRQAEGAAWQAYLKCADAVQLATTQAKLAACYAAGPSITRGGKLSAERAGLAFAYSVEVMLGANATRRPLQCDLLHDLFGNPFRPVSADPAWLRWNDGTVRKMAQALYEERAFERLPLLADALEDAGCTEDALLSHLRGPGPHVRGCWALDLLRGE
jgi:hypothetical protein